MIWNSAWGIVNLQDDNYCQLSHVEIEFGLLSDVTENPWLDSGVDGGDILAEADMCNQSSYKICTLDKASSNTVNMVHLNIIRISAHYEEFKILVVYWTILQ